VPHIAFALFQSRAHRELHSFPTRRSSDLGPPYFAVSYDNGETFSNIGEQNIPAIAIRGSIGMGFLGDGSGNAVRSINSGASWTRSEEHTSELQSRENLVCRLLLDKKQNSR